MRFSSLAPILTAITALPMLPTAKADVAAQLGKWQVDVPATIEAAKQSPKYKPEEDDKMATMVASDAA